MSFGVFRPAPRVPWIRRRPVLPVSGASLRAQAAVAVAVATAGATPVKVAVQGGSCAAVAVGGGAAVRRAPTTGAGVGVAAAAATPKKAARPTGPAVAVGVPGGGTYARTTLQGGSAFAVAVSTGRVISGYPCVAVAVTLNPVPVSKLVGSRGDGAAVATSSAAGRKVADVAGRCYAVGGASSSAGKRGLAQGLVVAVAVGTVRFAARVRGVGLVLGVSTATPVKRARETGTTAALAAAAGAAAKRAPAAGRGVGCGTAYGTALRRAPARGGCFGLGVARSFPSVVGPATGYRISPPIALPELPIAGSRVMWDATLPPGTSVAVETSVDNGATWQPATNGGPIARLLPGTTLARTVLTKATLTRPSGFDASPRLHRLQVEIALDASAAELLPVGVFTLNDVEVRDSAAGQEIELSGADLSRKISRNRWEDTYIVAEGTNYGIAIREMIENRRPGTVFNFASTSRTTPRLFFGEQSSNDPWQDAQEMASAIGWELFFDARGVCCARPEPDPDIGDSVWEFEDTANPTMIELARRVTDENTYNKVIVTGEGTSNDAPVRGSAIDDDPSSPTYHLGPYGTVTLRVTSPLVLTAEQAQDAADARLRRVKGATEAVELSAVPMPALEPGDVVTVTRGRAKVQGRFLIDQLRIPLGPDQPMRAVGRRQRQ